MDPEERLLVVVKDVSVEVLILFLRALARHLRPERMRIVDRLGNRLFLRCGSFLSLLRCLFRSLLVPLDPSLLALLLALLRSSAHILKIDRGRHKGAVFLQDLTDAELIAELETVVIQEQGDFRTDFAPRSLSDLIVRYAVALPMDRLCAVHIAQCIDMDLVSYHKCRVEAQTEVTDDLILICLALVLFEEFICTGEGDLRDILFDLVHRHADTGIDELECFLIRVHNDMNFVFVLFLRSVLADALKLSQLRDGIAGICDLLAYKNIMIRIKPLFNDRQHVLTVDR